MKVPKRYVIKIGKSCSYCGYTFTFKNKDNGTEYDLASFGSLGELKAFIQGLFYALDKQYKKW